MGQWEREGEDPLYRAPEKQERVSGAKLGGCGLADLSARVVGGADPGE